ncbi:unnamed protein product, partial [Sphacelaria rigidula]
GTRWVFKVKADGRFKARLVVQGWAQRHGLDCGSTFAPVCRLESQRLLLAIATAKNWPILALDIQTAFLNGKLQETVFCKQAPGFEILDPTTGKPHVMKLKRAIYGLRQSPNVWNSTIDTKLRTLGFNPTVSDPCVYTKGSHGGYIMLTLFVDDILMTGPSINLLHQVQDLLKTSFSISELGLVSLILGMEVIRDEARGSLKLSQHKYVKSLLLKFGMESSNPVHTPGIPGQLTEDTPEDNFLEQSEKTRYQAMVGSLIFLAQSTRFDIAFSVSQVARHMSKPNIHHLAAVKRVFRYLKGKPDLPLIYSTSDKNLNLIGYCDASYGTSGIEGRLRSTTGTMFFLAGGPINFSSSLQRITATSTTEAELIALSKCGKFGTYLFNLVKELGWSSMEPATIYSDSQGALPLSSNANYSSSSKHLAIRFYNLKDMIRAGQLKINHVRSGHQLADILTKFCSR